MASTIITKKSDKDDEDQACHHLRQALNVCGFKDWAINKALKPKSESNIQPKQSGDTKHNVSVTIPYHGDPSEKLRRIYKNHNIMTHFKPTNTLRQSLVHPKDKKQPHRRVSGVVYGVSCEPPCQDTYIGETIQPL
jgi:hypothetical protein